MGRGDDDDDGNNSEDSPGEAVPAAFSHVVKKRERHEDPKPFSLEEMKGAWVVVHANGFTYRGLLIGADENDIYLRGEMRWVVLPLADVTAVHVDERPRSS